jgi:hypothetical protein
LCKAKQSKAKQKKKKEKRKKKKKTKATSTNNSKKTQEQQTKLWKAQQSPKKRARLELSKERKAPKLFSFKKNPKKSTIPITTNKHNGMQCSCCCCCCCKMMMMMMVEEILSSKTAFGGRSFKNQTANQKLSLSLSLSLSLTAFCLSL